MSEWDDHPFPDDMPDTLRKRAELAQAGRCARCELQQAGDGGLCNICERIVQHEAERGLSRLGVYLEAWAAFDAWANTHSPEGSNAWT